MNPRIKGFIYVIIAAFLLALSPIGIEYMLATNNPETSSTVWTITAFLGSIILLFVTKEYKQVKSSFKYWKVIFTIGVLVAVATINWFYSINTIGPQVSSFLGRIGTLIVVILGIVILKEKFSLAEGFGAIITLIGIFIVTFSPIEYLGWDVRFIVFGSTMYGFSQLIAKKYSKKISPLVLTVTTGSIVTITLLLFAILNNKLHMPNIDNLLFFIVPILAQTAPVILVYNSYRYIGVGKSQIIRSSFPFIVILYSYLLYRTFPLPHQLIAGIQIIIGVIILTVSRHYKEFVSK